MGVLLYFGKDLECFYELFILEECRHRHNIKKVVSVALSCGLMDRQHSFLYLICHFNKYGFAIIHSSCQAKCLKFNNFYVLHHNDMWNLREQVCRKEPTETWEEKRHFQLAF